jgi:hypothetical protein
MSKLTIAADPASNIAQAAADATGEIAKASAKVGDAVAKVRTAEIKASADVVLAKIGLAKAVVELGGKVVDYFATREEWGAKVATAEKAVEKAWIELEKAQGDQRNRMEELLQQREFRQPFMDLIHHLVEQVRQSNLPPEDRNQLIGQAIQVGEMLAGSKR